MCTAIATNTASAMLVAQAALMSKVIALSALVSIVALNLRGKLAGFFKALPKVFKL